MAALLFVAICLTLAFLLVTQIITPLVGGLLFAMALALFGVMSRGFTKTTPSE
jgi:hypothetical protein